MAGYLGAHEIGSWCDQTQIQLHALLWYIQLRRGDAECSVHLGKPLVLGWGKTRGLSADTNDMLDQRRTSANYH